MGIRRKIFGSNETVRKVFFPSGIPKTTCADEGNDNKEKKKTRGSFAYTELVFPVNEIIDDNKQNADVFVLAVKINRSRVEIYEKFVILAFLSEPETKAWNTKKKRKGEWERRNERERERVKENNVIFGQNSKEFSAWEQARLEGQKSMRVKVKRPNRPGNPRALATLFFFTLILIAFLLFLSVSCAPLASRPIHTHTHTNGIPHPHGRRIFTCTGEKGVKGCKKCSEEQRKNKVLTQS